MSSPRVSAQIVFFMYIPMLIADVTIFGRLLYRLNRNNITDKKKVSTFQYRLHFTCFCCILLTSICDICHSFGSMITGTTLDSDIPIISMITIAADFFYFLSSLLIYLILIHRLHITFKGTAYELPRATLTALCTFKIEKRSSPQRWAKDFELYVFDSFHPVL